ncbi:MAG: hypothetical protein GX128_01165 [Bacteroidales bacterium]|nr:hypothetical protein [Bacteroidales bacterium]
MKKYTFLVYHEDYQIFLEKLRKVGVVDIVERTKNMDDETRVQLMEQRAIQETIKLLNRRRIASKDSPSPETDGIAIVEKVRELLNEEDGFEQQLNSVNKEISNLEPWGDFSLGTLENLKKADLNVSFYIASAKRYNPEWENQYAIGVVRSTPTSVYFILVSDSDEPVELSAEEVKAPELSVTEVIKRRDAILERKKKVADMLDEFAATSIPVLEETLQKLKTKADFNRVISNTRVEADEKLMLLQGYVPESEEQKLIEFCEENKILYVEGQPEETDKIPILLQNKPFAKLFEPIGSLFSLPSYHELDLTQFFAPFFMMFFGFCVGDAGYGLLILILSLLLKRKVDPSFRPYLSLAQYLGIGTVILGTLSGTFFGISLIDANIPFLSGMREYFLDSQKMFYLALILGCVQILFGLFVKILNITKQRGFKYAFSTLGWLVLFLGLIARVILVQTKILPEGEKIVLYSVLAVSGVFIFLLNDPNVNIFVRIGKGIWDIYGMATGLFGDILSYIRLFALGIASSILGFVINSVGLSLLETPYVGPVIFVIFLTLAHTLNILIASLGAFVHPMRLTFVEFFKYAGFNGGGKEYKPFTEKIKK